MCVCVCVCVCVCACVCMCTVSLLHPLHPLHPSDSQAPSQEQPCVRWWWQPTQHGGGHQQRAATRGRVLQQELTHTAPASTDATVLAVVVVVTFNLRSQCYCFDGAWCISLSLTHTHTSRTEMVASCIAWYTIICTSLSQMCKAPTYIQPALVSVPLVLVIKLIIYELAVSCSSLNARHQL